MKQHGIIFDCDGTLVDSLKQGLESFNYAFQKIGEKPRSAETIKRYFGAAADRIFLEILGREDKAQEAFEHYLEHQTGLANSMRLHDGIEDLLKVLAREQIPLAIVTGRHARDLEIVLKPHRLVEYFVVMIADNHLPHSKPAPDGILLAAKKMGLKPESTFYVGDSATDLQAAHAAGSLPVAALWDDWVRAEDLARERPVFMAAKPSEVWEFFKKTFRP